MRQAAIVAVSILSMAAAACSAGAREGGDDSERPSAQRNFQVGAFQSIALSGSPDVIVTVGGAPSVRAEGDPRLVERLEIRVENGSLKIGYRENTGWNLNFGSHRNATVHVTVPTLAAAAVTGSGDMRIDRVQGDRFAGTVTGSGDLEIGQARIGQAMFAVTGSGAIRAAGAAQRSEVELAGSGDVDLANLESRDAILSLRGSGDITANATQTARAGLFGSGDIAVTGTARCQIEKRGSGNVVCGGREG